MIRSKSQPISLGTEPPPTAIDAGGSFDVGLRRRTGTALRTPGTMHPRRDLDETPADLDSAGVATQRVCGSADEHWHPLVPTRPVVGGRPAGTATGVQQ
ncbi:hypothetical protein Pla86_45890 [Planctomycetes bacterium Pla86]|uniref:Uncharacterized protein n=1 Tax=Engelhardtia mirabilis TaxID=2528011 RepID=A0A518BR87_9BACT|nr:hypothetical protein Pla133_45910 [Planctomycetes bacterium Pla133]QDV03797.1 hypothetical protein Pla86_45890 [Planctomycetes bacterium Pla86]